MSDNVGHTAQQGDTPATDADTAAQDAAVAPVVPLAVLEAVRHHDRPKEVLEEEDLPSSLPRRLGLTGVVDVQIRRYEDAVRRREKVRADDVVNLLRLVMRRPDAQDILREAGRDVAGRFARGPMARFAKAVPLWPHALRRALARRATRRMLARIAHGGAHVDGHPVTVRLENTITGAADDAGDACVFYAAAIEEIVSLITHDHPVVEQVECCAEGADACVWTVRD